MDFLMLHAILILENKIIKYKFISDSALYPLSLLEVGILKQPSDISIVIKNNDYCHSYNMFDEVFQPSLRPRGRGYAFIDISNVFKLKTGRVIQRSMLYRYVACICFFIPKKEPQHIKFSFTSICLFSDQNIYFQKSYFVVRIYLRI